MRRVHPLLFGALLAQGAGAQSWISRDPVPTAMSSIAWDAGRERAVLVTELGLRLLVHEWDGSRWTPCAPAAGPAPTRNIDHFYLFGFDPTHRRLVMLGAGQQLAWGWDGVSWSVLPPPPFAPRWTALTHDPTVDRMVVVDNTAILGVNTTWHFDGTSWVQVASNILLNDIRPTLAHDAARGRTVLRAGSTTYEWNGSGWVGGVTSTVPTTGLPLLYDAQRGKVVVPSAGTVQWQWTGSDWAAFASPSAGLGNAHATASVARVRRLDGTDAAARERRLGRPGTAAPHRRRLVLDRRLHARLHRHRRDAGELQSNATRRHAALDALRLAVPRHSRPAGAAECRAGRSRSRWRRLSLRRQRSGGSDPAANFAPTDELWAFDGTAWSQNLAPGAPAARYNGALAIDVARQRLVSFGGYGSFYLNDTREFDGVQWWPRYPTHAPSPRHSHAMCGSAALGSVFLYGGYTAPTGAQSTEFWAWDGTDWTQLPSPPTGAVNYFGLAEHVATGTVVLTANITGTVDSTWSWNGASWTRWPDGPYGTRAIVAVPRLGSVLAPFGGAMLTTQPAAVSAFGSGCPGSAGQPTLRPFGLPSLGNGSYAFDLRTMLAGQAAALVAFGFVGANQQLPGGCTLLLDPVAMQFALASDGFVAVPLAVPDDLGLRGVSILAQGVVLDPAAPAGVVQKPRRGSSRHRRPAGWGPPLAGQGWLPAAIHLEVSDRLRRYVIDHPHRPSLTRRTSFGTTRVTGGAPSSCSSTQGFDADPRSDNLSQTDYECIARRKT